jgi:hypothetical protein
MSKPPLPRRRFTERYSKYFLSGVIIAESGVGGDVKSVKNATKASSSVFWPVHDQQGC